MAYAGLVGLRQLAEMYFRNLLDRAEYRRIETEYFKLREQFFSLGDVLPVEDRQFADHHHAQLRKTLVGLCQDGIELGHSLGIQSLKLQIMRGDYQEFYRKHQHVQNP
jgi:hypothetical protein